MTRALADRTGARALVRGWKTLGAPVGAPRALAIGPQGHELARAVMDTLSPAELVLLHPAPAAARARFRSEAGDLATLSQSDAGGFDLILVGGGLEAGDLASVSDAVGRLGAILRPGGGLALIVDTLAAPLPGETGDAFDHLLFPHLAASGELGEAGAARAPLPASAWRLLLQRAGLKVAQMQAANAGLPEAMSVDHGARLAIYDAQELTFGRLNILASKPGRRK